jgi:hypothetical protein
MKKLLLALILCSGSAFAQQEGTFYFMNTISQSTYFNPAFTPKYNTTIGLPGLASNYVGVINSGFAFNDLIVRRDEDDSLVVTLDNFYKQLNDDNHFKVQSMVDIFHLSFKLNPRMHFTMNVTHKNHVHLIYPKEIANLLINGNEPYKYENTNFSLNLNGSGYIESGLGLNYKINQFWTVGARFKMLKGHTNVTTEKADFIINTAANNQIELIGDASINIAGTEIFDDEIKKYSDKKYSDLKKYLTNNGYGFDLGIAFKPMERLTLGLSVVDIGSIKWVNGVKTHLLDPANAKYIFEGVDLSRLINKDPDYDLDSLEEKFEFQESDGSSYRSTLPTKFYLSGSYELGRKLYTNLLLAGEKSNDVFNTYATANLTKNLGKAMTVSVSYTAAQNVYNNWGAGISFNLAPFQFYVVGDNLLGAATSGGFKKDYKPHVEGLQFFNIRFGLNFIGAWEKTTEKLSDDKF